MIGRFDSQLRRAALTLALPAALACGLAAPVFAKGTATSTASSTTIATAGKAKSQLSLDTALTPFTPPVVDSAKFSFTAPGRPNSSARLATVERAFRFTPSGQTDNRKALSLGVSSRMTAAPAETVRAATETAATAPTAYNVDLAVGWKGFAINTGYSRVDAGTTALVPLGRKEAVDLGVSYRGKNWKTGVLATAEQGSTLLLSPLDRRYSVEFGGAYVFNPRLSLSGGVRYKLAPETPTLLDPDKADQAIYLGTNIAF